MRSVGTTWATRAAILRPQCLRVPCRGWTREARRLARKGRVGGGQGIHRPSAKRRAGLYRRMASREPGRAGTQIPAWAKTLARAALVAAQASAAGISRSRWLKGSTITGPS